MRIPVHSPWLPGYADIAQTTLVIITMAGLFLDSPHISKVDADYWNLRKQEPAPLQVLLMERS